jgi:hypothetical protein
MNQQDFRPQQTRNPAKDGNASTAGFFSGLLEASGWRSRMRRLLCGFANCAPGGPGSLSGRYYGRSAFDGWTRQGEGGESRRMGDVTSVLPESRKHGPGDRKAAMERREAMRVLRGWRSQADRGARPKWTVRRAALRPPHCITRAQSRRENHNGCLKYHCHHRADAPGERNASRLGAARPGDP